MSTSFPAAPGVNDSVRLEEDRVPSGLVAGALAGTVAVTLLCLAVAAGLLARFERPAGGVREARRAPEPDQVFHGLIAVERPGLRERERARAERDSWGWVDRQRRLVRMPVERAYDRVIEEARR